MAAGDLPRPSKCTVCVNDESDRFELIATHNTIDGISMDTTFVWQCLSCGATMRLTGSGEVQHNKTEEIYAG